MINPSIANGNITPFRAVKADNSGDNLSIQAGAGDVVIGVAQRGTRNTPYATLNDGFCAIAGESYQVYGLGETCILELGGTVAAGDTLKSDASGRGVTTTTPGDQVFFRAGQAGTIGQLIEGEVIDRPR